MTTPGAPPRRAPESIVVTSAYRSRGEEIDARRTRYVWAMSGRVVLIALSVLFLRGHLWLLLPATFLSAVLPYFAVVVANGGRKKPEMGDAYVHDATPVPAVGPGRTIDAD